MGTLSGSSICRSLCSDGWPRSAEIENTATGVRDGVEIVIADYWLAPTSVPEYDDRERYTCVLIPAPAGWPDLSVVPERLVSRLRSSFAMPDIGTESDRFNRRFEVRSGDRRFANAFLDARMMEWLLEQVPGMGFEVAAGRLLVFRPRASTSLDDLGRALALLDDFEDKVPRVVRQERG